MHTTYRWIATSILINGLEVQWQTAVFRSAGRVNAARATKQTEWQKKDGKNITLCVCHKNKAANGRRAHLILCSLFAAADAVATRF